MWILALTTVGTLIIMARPDAELTPGFSVPPRNALLYTLDLLLPFVDLGYSRWIAHGRVLTVTTVLVGLGWVLATAVVAALADVHASQRLKLPRRATRPSNGRLSDDAEIVMGGLSLTNQPFRMYRGE